jgi:transposase-like protein
MYPIQGRKFSREFKLEAVNLVRERGRDGGPGVP